MLPRPDACSFMRVCEAIRDCNFYLERYSFSTTVKTDRQVLHRHLLPWWFE